jgi:hypothetical protein
VKNKQLKQIITETVLDFLNETDNVNVPVIAEEEGTELTPQQRQEIESKIRSISKNAGIMSYSYGTNKKENKSWIGVNIDPTAKGDWARTREERLYELPFEYNDALHHFAQEIWKKIKDEQHIKEHPAIDMNKDEALRALDAASKNIDWYYEMSDDHNVWRAGNERMRVLKNVLEKAALANPEGSLTILKANAPAGWHKWAEDFIKRIQDNREHYLKHWNVK